MSGSLISFVFTWNKQFLSLARRYLLFSPQLLSLFRFSFLRFSPPLVFVIICSTLSDFFLYSSFSGFSFETGILALYLYCLAALSLAKPT
jgi:hypothetical protein